MTFNIPRPWAQGFAIFSILVSIAMIPMGYHIETGLFFGFSVITLMLSESFLLQRVQNEMTVTLELLRQKQDSEIQDLLYFLRASKLSQSPLETTAGAVKLLKKIKFPAFVMGPTMEIICANDLFANLLGYASGALNGAPVVRINNKVLMSEVGKITSQPPHTVKPAMHMRYLYEHASGKNIFGNLSVHKMPDHSYFMMFHPDEAEVISQKKMMKLINCKQSNNTL